MKNHQLSGENKDISKGGINYAYSVTQMGFKVSLENRKCYLAAKKILVIHLKLNHIFM